MPRRVQVVVECDICLGTTEDDTVDNLAFAGQEVELDLCDKDRKKLSDAIAPFMEAGHKVGKSKKLEQASPEKKATCPECGRGMATRETLKRHVETKHGTTLNELLEKSGEIQNIEILNCPECQDSFVRKQGLAAHRRQKHGVMGASASRIRHPRRKTAASA